MPTPPYDIANTILNAARVRLNSDVETLIPIGGELLDNTQPFIQQAFNSGFRKLQEFLADQGFARLEQEIILSGYPPLPSIDPAVQPWLDWTGSFDGATFSATPQLPQDFISPLWVKERPTGSVESFADMDRISNGMPSVPKVQWNLMWEWRDDKLYFPGSVRQMDLRMRYAAYLPDIADVGTTPWFMQPVPITRCLESMTNYLCAEICAAREQMDWAAAYATAAEMAAQQIFNRDDAESKRIVKPSEHGKMGDKRMSA